MEGDAKKFTRAPTPEDSLRLTALGQELVQIDERLKKWKLLAEELNLRKTKIQMQEMVDLMDEIGQDIIGLPNEGEYGVDLVLSDYVKAGLPNPGEKDDDFAEKMELRRQGLEWLGEHAEGLINTTLAVTMPKGSLPHARVMRDTIVQLFGVESTPARRAEYLSEVLEPYLLERNEPGIQPGSVSIEEGVHWATLTSFVKEQVKKPGAEELPLDALGATVGRIVTIKPRKKPK